MKILVAVLISAALFWAVPTEQPPVNNLGQKPVQTTKAEKLVAKTKEADAIVIPAEKQDVQKVEVQPEPVAIPEPEPGTPDAWMNAVGLTESEKEAARYIVGQESGWCPTKWQGQYGHCPECHGVPQDSNTGYGLCQATPAWKMASAGDDWATNPITQLKWCNEYVQEYGGWEKAAEFKRCTGLCYSTRILANTFKHTPWF